MRIRCSSSSVATHPQGGSTSPKAIIEAACYVFVTAFGTLFARRCVVAPQAPRYGEVGPPFAFLQRPRSLVSALLIYFLVLFVYPVFGAEQIERIALNPVSPIGEAMQFTEIPREHSGLADQNNYDDPAMWETKFLEFTLGAIGTGVAIGDYDRDGLPDLFIASKTGKDRLYRNLGAFRFEDVTDFAGVGGELGVWTQGVAFADCNGDGWLDLFVCRFDAPNFLYLNNGDRTFREVGEWAGVAVEDASAMASFADYDNDGDLDFYLLTNLLSIRDAPSGQPDRLFRNKGDGCFEEVTSQAGIVGDGQGHSATWFDYNQDGLLDIYVANDFTPADKLYHNVGDGRFVDALSIVVPHTPNSSMGADIADFNRDGLIDFFVADMAATNHRKDMRGMVNGREESVDPTSDPFSAQQYPRNAAFLNSGLGPFLEVAHLLGLEATDWTWSVRFEDLDNDGWEDLHVTTGMVRELHNTDLMKRVREARSPLQRIGIVKTSPPFAEANLAYRNLGDLIFEEVGSSWGLDELGVSFGAAFGDLDRDGDLDLVYSNMDKGVSLLRNDAPAGNRLLLELQGKESNRFGVGATVTIETASGKQTKQLSLSRGYASTSEPILHFGLGEDDDVSKLEIQWPSGKRQVLRNLDSGFLYRVREGESAGSTPNKDATLIVEYAEKSREIELLHRTEERFEFERKDQPFLPVRHNRVGPALVVGDVNGDGAEDVVIGGTSRDPITLFTKSEDGKFEVSESGFLGRRKVNDGAILLADFDGDGSRDLLVTGAGVAEMQGHAAYQVGVYLNDGHGSFDVERQYPSPSFSESVAAAATADFDRDGDLDVFLGGRVVPGKFPEAPLSGLFRNDGDGFVDVTESVSKELKQIGMVADARWSDLNGDGWQDLLLALDWGPVLAMINREGEFFEDQSEALGLESAGRGWWRSIASGDFNDDGQLDYILGNAGLNTPYQASEEYPAVLYLGAFVPDGKIHLIEAKYESGRLVPVRGFDVLKKRIPTLEERFDGNDVFAEAGLEEVVGEYFMNTAERFEVDQLASGVLLSGNEGIFSFRSFPRLAQAAPLQGIVTGDIDADGFCDVYALQNDFSPIPSVGRFDGGLSVLMTGDGKGNLVAQLPNKTGLLVTGEGRALCLSDFDDNGSPDFLLSRNNSSVLAYASQDRDDRRFLRVAIDGPAGNIDGIGSLVTLRRDDDTLQVQEINRGGGGLGQSTRYLFFSQPNTSGGVLSIRWPDGTEEQFVVEGGQSRLRVRYGSGESSF